MNIRTLHYVSGIVLSLFIGVHLCNHVWAIFGIEQHISLMENLRWVYRNIFVEVVLLAAVVVQVVSGITLVRKRRGTPKLGWDRWHIGSGLYLAFFLLLHTSAVVMGRWVLHLDTNFYFGAAGMNAFPTCLFFIPYYTLAIMALTIHIAAIHHQKMAHNILGWTPHRQSLGIVFAGMVVTFLVLWGMTQGFGGVVVPQAYQILQGK